MELTAAESWGRLLHPGETIQELKPEGAELPSPAPNDQIQPDSGPSTLLRTLLSPASPCLLRAPQTPRAEEQAPNLETVGTLQMQTTRVPQEGNESSVCHTIENPFLKCLSLFSGPCLPCRDWVGLSCMLLKGFEAHFSPAGHGGQIFS